MANRQLIGLDVGTARIGVAVADGSIRIAIPHGTIDVNGDEVKSIAELVVRNDCDTIVIGYPRNQSGEATEQTRLVEAFAAQLEDLNAKLVFQDESLTSVMAEQRLQARSQPYSKGDIDSEAAAIILQDYMEQHL